jgi:hypothetical protein
MSDSNTKGNQTLDTSRLRGTSPKRGDREPQYKGGYAGPNNGGPADEQTKAG